MRIHIRPRCRDFFFSFIVSGHTVTRNEGVSQKTVHSDRNVHWTFLSDAKAWTFLLDAKARTVFCTLRRAIY